VESLIAAQGSSTRRSSGEVAVRDAVVVLDAVLDAVLGGFDRVVVGVAVSVVSQAQVATRTSGSIDVARSMAAL
jgi:hypothetical protein